MNKLEAAALLALIAAIIGFFIYLLFIYGGMAFGDVPLWVIFILFGGSIFGSSKK